MLPSILRVLASYLLLLLSCFIVSFSSNLPLTTKYIKLGVDLVYKYRGALYSALQHPNALFYPYPPSKKSSIYSYHVEVGVFANRAIF